MKIASYLGGACTLAALTLHAAAPTPEAASLGRLDFPVTGSAECQRLFTQGLLEMHSFQYDQAHASFQAALAADADCAMAAWGDAMAHEHPIWSQRQVEKSKAALARIRNEHRLTAKERAFIAMAREVFSVEGSKAGLNAWLAAAEKLHAAYPEDDEAALQHALARIAVYDDAGNPRELAKAGAIALDVMHRRPEHPGAAHYVIHAFDTTDLAVLALPAARLYARIAPGSAHALHMPSHTFTHLGLWSEVVPSNVRAFAVSKEAAKKLGQGAEAWDWHAYSWLVAAHLELGQHRRAKELVDEAKALFDKGRSLRYGYVDVVASYVTQTGRWAEVESLAAPVFPRDALQAKASMSRLRAEAALRARDAAAAEKSIKEALQFHEQLKGSAGMRRPELQLAHIEELQARARLVGARSAENESHAQAALERSVQLYDAIPVSGPAFSLTPRERLAETLAAAGRHAEALAHYERVLDSRPNRAFSLLGAARAARAAGDAAKAQAHYKALAALWKDADGDLAALAEVRAGAAAKP